MDSEAGDVNALQLVGGEGSIHDEISSHNDFLLGGLKQSVNKLVSNQIDEFEVLFLAQKLSLKRGK